jgi:pumilio homology domain family member 6
MPTSDTKTAAESLLSTLLPQANDQEEPLSISSAHVARLFKALLQGGHFSQATKLVERSPHFDREGLVHSFVETVGQERTLEMTREGGAFVVIELLEALEQDEKLSKERDLVRSWFDKPTKKQLAGSDIKGRDLLLEKLGKL